LESPKTTDVFRGKDKVAEKPHGVLAQAIGRSLPKPLHQLDWNDAMHEKNHEVFGETVGAMEFLVIRFSLRQSSDLILVALDEAGHD
jgi:hypothetical protein